MGKKDDRIAEALANPVYSPPTRVTTSTGSYPSYGSYRPSIMPSKPYEPIDYGPLFDTETVERMKEALAAYRNTKFGTREVLPHQPHGIDGVIHNALVSAVSAIDHVLGNILDEKPLDTEAIFTALESVRAAIKKLETQ